MIYRQTIRYGALVVSFVGSLAGCSGIADVVKNAATDPSVACIDDTFSMSTMGLTLAETFHVVRSNAATSGKASDGSSGCAVDQVGASGTPVTTLTSGVAAVVPVTPVATK